ncbi:hypothetical protein [Frateuria sp. YIM B11624]|uniref:hypothetical protein n=1 Tax=Frateuria sp. YIM B11624 TaxID=3143185 RepID=UPI003C745D5A
MSAKGERRRDSVPLILQQLKEEPGPLALNWLGSLRKRITRSGQRYSIQAQFRRLLEVATPLEVTIPMEAFHLLAVGTRWRYGTFAGYGFGRTCWVQLDLPALDTQGQHRALRPHEAMPDWTYPLYDMMHPGSVRVIPVVGGADLVFPIAEMVRAWYLFHPAMLRVILGDGINQPRSMARGDLPWDPDETRETGDGAHVTYDTTFGDGPMKRLARLLFDGYARQKVGAFSRRLREYSEKDVFPFPYTVPPLQDQPLLKIHYIDIEEWEGHRPPRRLVLSVLAVRHPPPYRFITWDAKHDNRQDPNADPQRPTITPFSAPGIITDGEGVTLAGEGADPSVESVRTHLLGFDDDAYDVPTERAPRRPSTHQAGGRGPNPVPVTYTAPNTGGGGEAGVAELVGGDMLPTSTEEEKGRGGPPIALIRMRTIFDRAIALLTSQLPSWTVTYLTLAGMDNGVLDIVHEKRADYRFLILHARSPGRHVYALHGTPVDEEKAHQLFACRQPSSLPLTTQQFIQWLSGVPYAGRPIWVNKESDGLRLIPKAFNHKRYDASFDEATWIREFADNVVKAVLAIALG